MSLRKPILAGLALILGLGAALAGLLAWLATSLPQEEGVLALAGPKARIALARDKDGVAHILAASEADAYFALGFAHAQDRLWQMELQRRIGAGRLAEILGERALPTDRFMRTLGLYRLAEAGLGRLSPGALAALDAYAAGVNANLAGRKGALPPEFAALMLTPEPWRPADSLVWGRLMALQLGANWQDELLRAKIGRKLSPSQIADLWPGYPDNQPVSIGLAPDLAGAMLAAIPPILAPQLASNAWVVSGKRTASGKPLLANDPHLGFQAPILWYLARIQAPGLDLAGATVPGTPFHLLGHNGHVAWGITTTHGDTMDLFIEKPDGAGYATPAGPMPFATRSETIKVRGGRQEILTVRETRHGPIVSDVLGARADGRILALAATMLAPDDRTAEAVYRLNHARDRAEILAALKDFHAPQQNILYAGADGHFGMVVAGRVPLRAGGDGTVPRPGWDGSYDWQGWIPFEALPRIEDPPEGFVVNANNKPVGRDYPYLLSVSWPEGYRAARIVEMLTGNHAATPADMAALQMDETSLMARELLPLLLARPAGDERAGRALALLAGWDGDMAADRPEPLLFQSWLVRLQEKLLQPWLGQDAAAFGAIHPRLIKAVLEGRHEWCKGGTTGNEACAALVSSSLAETLDRLEKRFGRDWAAWRWGTVHRARFDALLFGRLPVLDALTRQEAPMGGDDFTVQRGSFSVNEDGLFVQHHGAGLRAVYDLDDLDASRFTIATGQSGNVFSRHWSDFFIRWTKGSALTLPKRAEMPSVLFLDPLSQSPKGTAVQ